MAMLTSGISKRPIRQLASRAIPAGQSFISPSHLLSSMRRNRRIHHCQPYRIPDAPGINASSSVCFCASVNEPVRSDSALRMARIASSAHLVSPSESDRSGEASGKEAAVRQERLPGVRPAQVGSWCALAGLSTNISVCFALDAGQ
jgi:hypothetical protein